MEVFLKNIFQIKSLGCCCSAVETHRVTGSHPVSFSSVATGTKILGNKGEASKKQPARRRWPNGLINK